MAVRQWLIRRQVVALVGFVTFLGMRAQAADEAAEARMRHDITFLASDACEGRGVGTKGIDLAASHIAGEFQKAGLKPGGSDGSYFQPFTIAGPAVLKEPNSLVLRGPLGQVVELRQGSDFQVSGLSSQANVTAPVVFVGYGASAAKFGYDDYQGIDVTGKLVLVVRKTPRAETPNFQFDEKMAGYHAALVTKLMNAEKHKAAGVLLVSDRAFAKNSDPLMRFSEHAYFNSGSRLPAVHLRRAVADQMLQASLGKSLLDLETDIDRDLKPRSTLLAGWTASLQTAVERSTIPAKNVVGVLEGSGSLANETVIIGAHYDHLGYGGMGSLAPEEQKGKAIHHGADDNGSGTTTLLELARRFGQKPEPNARRLVFIAFSGEESGLLGSLYYCRNPLFPLASTAAMVNMDMIGRMRPDKETHKDRLVVYGTGSARTFEKLIDSVGAKYPIQLAKVPGISVGLGGASDHQSFYMKNIPIIFFFTDYHEDYHRPSDTADKINIPGMALIADLTNDLVEHLRAAPDRPQFVAQAPTEAPHAMDANGPRLRILFDYADTKEGALVNGVIAGGPAAKAGIKSGDRIVEMAGQPIKNVQSYMAVMAGQHKGDSLAITVLRAGQKETIKVKLE